MSAAQLLSEIGRFFVWSGSVYLAVAFVAMELDMGLWPDWLRAVWLVAQSLAWLKILDSVDAIRRWGFWWRAEK